MSILDRTWITHRWAARRAWKAARNFTDLCDLTASWLMGEIPWQPGYYGTVDVDEDEAPGLTDALVALNLAGIMTTNSQAGSVDYEQVAAIDGRIRAEDVPRLAAFAEAHGYRFSCDRWVNVTWQDGDPFTRFGGPVPSWDFNDYYGFLHGDAYDELRAARTFVLFDPQMGRNDLCADLFAWLGANCPTREVTA